MGQQNDSGRNASLDQNKSRAAGRRGRTGQDAPGAAAIRDAVVPEDAKGKTAGAFGAEGMANRKGGVSTQGGGGGGGASSPDHAMPLNVPASTRKARKRS